MAIARLAETLGADNVTAGNYDISVSAPASTPNGVCVVIVQSGTAGTADNVSTVSYGVSTGAVLLTERRFQTEATEPGAVWLYWASGVAFPAGAQTVRIVRTGTVAMRAAVCPMTCAAGQQIGVDADNFGTSASVANPSWTMTTVATITECYLGIHSGLTTMTTTPATNWTLIGSDDLGQFGRGWARRTMTAAGAAAPGWTAATAEDFVGISAAFKEAPLTAPSSGIIRPRRTRNHPSFRR
jgi:hypothetical protein